MYGLTYKFDVKSGNITALTQDVLAVNSVAVGYLTVETSLAEGQIMEVTFGKFNASKSNFTVLTPALGFECVNIESETWQVAIPDIMFAEGGEYAFSLAVKSPYIKSDGTTGYSVLTTVQVGFTVSNSIAVVAHNPLTPTEVDTINAELAALSKRVSIVESKVTNTVVVDFSVNEETGVATIVYNNGTTKTVQLPLETIDAVYQTGLVTVLNFTADSWEGDINSGYILAFGAAQTGQSDKNFIVQLCAEGTETYKTGSETTASAKQGDYTRADTVFKGSDGSLLLHSTTTYGGSLVVLGGELKTAIVQESGNATDKAMSQKVVTDELSKKISNPVVSGNGYKLVTFNGKESGTLSYTNEPTPSSVVQRDADGRTQTEDGIGEKDVVNFGQLSAGYEKIPEYVLIEKVITGYTALTAEPEDFSANYANYYKTNGKARNDKDFNYVALTEAETFEAGKFYSYIDEASNLTRNGDSGKEPDGTAYSFKNLYIYGETKDELTYFADYGWAYFYVNNERRTNNTPFVYFSVAKSKSHRAQMYVNAQGNSVMGYTTDLGSHYLENHGSKTDVSSLQFRDTLVTITGVDISSLPAGTTILIYGVRK